MLTFETEGNTEHAQCSCCGKVIRLIWGYVFRNKIGYAAYYARLNEGHPERGLNMLIVSGAWGEESSEADRFCFSIDCRMGETRPSYMLIDADPTYIELGKPLSREEALQHPFKDELFPMLDELVKNDLGIKKFLDSARK